MIRVMNKKTYKGKGVYIGRPTILANQWTHKRGTAAKFIVPTREDAILAYHEWLRGIWVDGGPEKDELMRLVNMYIETGELTLVCWCSPKACHGDVLKTAIRKIAQKMKEKV